MRRATLACLIFVASMSGCTRDEALYNPCPSCPAISFKADIIPLFAANCAVSGCHDAITHAFSLNLDSAHAYASATEPGTGNVTPYNPDGSLIYTLLLSTAAANHMPLYAPPLPACDIQTVACWINQGALNN